MRLSTLTHMRRRTRPAPRLPQHAPHRITPPAARLRLTSKPPKRQRRSSPERKRELSAQRKKKIRARRRSKEDRLNPVDYWQLPLDRETVNALVKWTGVVDAKTKKLIAGKLADRLRQAAAHDAKDIWNAFRCPHCGRAML